VGSHHFPIEFKGAVGQSLSEKDLSPTDKQSELGLEDREYTCDMGVSLSLLNNS